MQTLEKTPAHNAESVQKAVDAILKALGQPESDLHRTALEAFHREDYMQVKRLGSANLADNFCKALGYLGSAYKLTPNTDTILSESARAAAEFVKERTLKHLGLAITNI